MKQSIKSILLSLPKVFTFGLALLNFIYVSSHLPTMKSAGAITFCVVCPWYETSDYKDVLIILAASIFLLISSRISYLAALALSGYVLFTGLFYIARAAIYFGLSDYWHFILKEENIFLVWEVQVILAVIVFISAAFYLLQNKLDKKVGKQYL